MAHITSKAEVLRQERRLKWFPVNPFVFAAFCGFGAEKPRLVIEGVPADCEVCFVSYQCPVDQAVRVYVGHDTFERIPDAEEIPMLLATVQSIQDQPKESLYKRKSLI